jgi:hypothetical protein
LLRKEVFVENNTIGDLVDWKVLYRRYMVGR